MGMTINDFKEKLREKYGYSEEFAQDLSIMCESISDYYGETYKEVINDAVLSTKFVIAGKRPRSNINETIYDVAMKENMIDETSDIEFLKRTHSTFINRPTITFENGSYHLVKSDKIVILPGYFNPLNPGSLGILAKEIMNVIKSHLNGFSIENNKLYERRGLEVISYTLTNENNQVMRKKEKTHSIGLENGLNSYHELAIIRTSYDDNYDITGNDYERIVAGHLCDNLGLKDMFIEAQITKDITSLAQILNNNFQESYENLIGALDGLHQLESERTANILDNETLKKLNSDLEEHFQNNVAPLIQNMTYTLQNENDLEQNI